MSHNALSLLSDNEEEDDVWISDVESPREVKIREKPKNNSKEVVIIEDDIDRKHADGPDRDRSELVIDGVQVIKGAVGTKRDKDAYGGKQFRWWFFTWNNPKHPEDKDKLLKSKLHSYIKFQYEKGKEGTLHYQGVFYLKCTQACRSLLATYDRCGYFAPVISIEGATNYCGKTESRIDGPWTAGSLPAQGRRSDLIECKNIVDNGGGMDELFELQFANAVRYGRGLKEYVAIKRRGNVRKWQTVCYVYTGDAGTGKTQAAIAESTTWGGGTYWLTVEHTGGKLWWDGYEGQENVIVDEFNCGIPLTDFKRLIDCTPLSIPIKGGMTQFLAKRIWFLSNKVLDVWYYKAAPPGPDRNAFNRRIHYHERFDTLFQGAPGYQEYMETRIWFVQLQKKGVFKYGPK